MRFRYALGQQVKLIAFAVVALNGHRVFWQLFSQGDNEIIDLTPLGVGLSGPNNGVEMLTGMNAPGMLDQMM